MLRSNECGRATNAGGECGEATNALWANVLRTIAEGECPKDECCRATNVQARMSVTNAVGECETMVVMPRKKCLKALLNDRFSVSLKLL
jgi:hypothetical protein